MELALSLAKSAAATGEVPVGAIITKDDRIVSSGFNLKEKKQKVTGHAEIIAIERACKRLSSWRLTDCTLYVTLEPCLMCAGAIYQSKIPNVVFGTDDPKAGAFGSLYQINTDARLNHLVDVEHDILKEACSHELKTFFRNRRK